MDDRTKPEGAAAERQWKRRLPPWIGVRVPAGAASAAADVRSLLAQSGVRTVCQDAHCPNLPECYGRGTATFMILGAVCTRACGFCAVGTGRPPEPPDADEPARVAAAAARLQLKHVVVTSVTRDDVEDGGATVFAATIAAVRRQCPGATVEVLVPDFQGRAESVRLVLAARPDVFNHNVETVRRLQPLVRPDADYERSLGVLRLAARWEPELTVKSGIMVGLGETDAEVDETLGDLRAAGCALVSIGQYLAPSPAHLPEARFVTEAQFAAYAARARDLGFRGVASGPLVRSSYHAEALYTDTNRSEG
jgi:lipoic acid synthetase